MTEPAAVSGTRTSTSEFRSGLPAQRVMLAETADAETGSPWTIAKSRPVVAIEAAVEV